MGETLRTAGGAAIRVKIRTAACAGSTVHLLLDGEEVATSPAMTVDGGSDPVEATVSPSAGRHWLRVEVRDGKGSLQLTSSPIYINFSD
jgi:hypothetical protein